MNSVPMPLKSSNIAADPGVATFCAASNASRSALHRLDLLEQQFEPIEFPADLGLEMFWQGAAIARPQLVEPLASIAAQRLVAGYSLAEEQSFDPVDVLDSFVGQYLALAAETAVVLFFGCRRFDHRAHPRFAALIRQ